MMYDESQLQGLDVTITTTMQVLGVVVALALQFLKALTAEWKFLSEEMRKPLWPLVSIGLTMLIFWAGAIENWLIAGVAVGLAAAGGYSLFSGASKLANRKKAVPPVAAMLALSSLLLFAPGCQLFQRRPKAELLASQKTFTATVNSLTALRRAGKIDDDEAQQLTVWIHEGQDYLSQWEAAVKAGQSRPDIIEAFERILDQLITVQMQKGAEP